MNAFSSEIHKKLYSMPDDTSLQSIIATMENMEQATRESKICDQVTGNIPHKSAPHISAAHYSRNRESFSEESDSDYGFASSAHAAPIDSDDSADLSESDILQNISALEAQLAQLKTSVN